MTETRNLGLKKYEATDRYDLMASYNDSMDIIDAAFGDVESMIDTINEAQLGSLQTTINAGSTENIAVLIGMQPDTLATITLTASESISSEVLAGLKLVNYDTGERISFDADRNASYTCVIPHNGNETIILYNSSDEDFVTTPDEDFVCTVSYPVKLDEQQSRFISRKVFYNYFWQYFGIGGITYCSKELFEALVEEDRLESLKLYIVPNEDGESFRLYFGYQNAYGFVVPLREDIPQMGGLNLQKLTQSEFEALVEKDENTLYVVLPDPDEEVSGS